MLRSPTEEDPGCRCGEYTPAMISQITKWRLAYKKLPESSIKFYSEHFSRTVMAVDYVHNSNVGEMVGTQSWQETQDVIRKYCNGGLLGMKLLATRCEKETVNTYEAVKFLHNTHKVMSNTGLLTVQEVCDIHRVLLQDLHPDCGKMRTRDAYTHWHDGPHYYPPPEQAEELFYALIDHHNKRMAECQHASNSDEYTTYIFKCAADLLFEFVSVHPFGDGNGRMCRLLANYVVGLITPFPVSLYHNPESQNAREDYLSAIVHCREHPEDGPHELMAMLIQGAWHGWKCLFSGDLKRRDQL